MRSIIYFLVRRLREPVRTVQPVDSDLWLHQDWSEYESPAWKRLGNDDPLISNLPAFLRRQAS